MADNWKNVVTDAAERAVFAALEDPKWDFRTIDGLVSSTQLDPAKVTETIARYPAFIRRSPVPGPEGKDLFTLDMDLSSREALSVARGAISKTVPTESSDGPG
jgi:hypothetical protein